MREAVENGQLRVPFVRTVDNHADFFTKALPNATFYEMRDAIMNVSADDRRRCGGALISGCSGDVATDSMHATRAQGSPE